MELFKKLLIKYVYNSDVRCQHLTLAPNWSNGRPYGLYIKEVYSYARKHNLEKDHHIYMEDFPKEVLAYMYYSNSDFCGVIKGAYFAREAIAVDTLFKELHQEQRMVKYKISFMTKLAMKYDIDKMYWNGQLPFQQQGDNT